MNDDLISRQAVIDALDKEYRCTDRSDDWDGLKTAMLIIENLPSAQTEPCKDAVSRNAIIQKLNTMDRYVSEELRLCDTDKKFPKNEVFIVDDVYEEIVENLSSAQPSDEYSKGWHDGREALEKEIWEDGRDRLD